MSMVESWINDIKATNNGKELHHGKPTTNGGKELIVGFRCEWYYDINDIFDKNLPDSLKRMLLLLKFCVGSKCLLFHTQKTCMSGRVPEPSKSFLCDSGITFVGVGVTEELFKLQLYVGCDVGKSMELGPLAARKLGRKELLRVGLVDLAKTVLDLDIEKPVNLRWPVFDDTMLKHEFTYEQIKYGSVSCYVGFAIAQKLLEMD